MQGRPRRTLRTALQPMPASRIFADGWKGTGFRQRVTTGAPPLPTRATRLLLRGDETAWLVLLLLSLGRAWFAGIVPTLPVGRIRFLLLPQVGPCRRASPPFHQRPHHVARFDPVPVHASHHVFPVLHPVPRIVPIDLRHLQSVVHHHITLRLRSPHVDRLSLTEHLDLLLGQGLACNRQFRTRRF